MRIEKKAWPEYFQKIIDGDKTYDLRVADFECQPGDILVLKEWDPQTKKYTGRKIEKKVTYVGKTKNFNFWTQTEIEKYGYQIMAFGSKNRPKVGVAIIVCKDGKVLIGKRRGDHGGGKWGFPGGHLELGESFEECVVRELREECDITVNNIRFGAITNDIFESEKHYVTIFMIGDYKDGELKTMEPDKCEKWEWQQWSELPTNCFLPIKNLLKQQFNPFSKQK